MQNVFFFFKHFKCKKKYICIFIGTYLKKRILYGKWFNFLCIFLTSRKYKMVEKKHLKYKIENGFENPFQIQNGNAEFYSHFAFSKWFHLKWFYIAANSLHRSSNVMNRYCVQYTENEWLHQCITYAISPHRASGYRCNQSISLVHIAPYILYSTYFISQVPCIHLTE